MALYDLILKAAQDYDQIEISEIFDIENEDLSLIRLNYLFLKIEQYFYIFCETLFLANLDEVRSGDGDSPARLSYPSPDLTLSKILLEEDILDRIDNYLDDFVTHGVYYPTKIGDYLCQDNLFGEYFSQVMHCGTQESFWECISISEVLIEFKNLKSESYILPCRARYKEYDNTLPLLTL